MLSSVMYTIEYNIKVKLSILLFARLYEYIGAECSKLRQPMRAICALSRAQLLLLVVTRSRDLSRECHVTKHKTPARSNFPLSNFENSGTIQFSSSSSTSRGLRSKNFEKRVHPNSICSVVLINYFLKHLFQHYKSIIFIEDDTEGISM